MLATFVVNNLTDSFVGGPDQATSTLRQAIFDANDNPGPDTIVFEGAARSGVIKLQDGELTITDSVTILGPSAIQLTIDANDPTPDDANGDGNRSFNIDDGTATLLDVVISGLTLTGGDVNDLGGAIRSKENLTIQESLITGKSVSSTAGFLTPAVGSIRMTPI